MAKRKNSKKPRAGTCETFEILRTFGDPVLKQQTRPVTSFDPHLRKLCETMFDIMEREEGVGLAAPQIGVLSRLMVWADPDEDYKRHIFVNPHILHMSDVTTVEPEGCLSLPGEMMEVPRADEVLVEAQDVEGEVFRMQLSGFQARVVQHEVDHLDGRLILDRTSPEERRRVLKEMRDRVLEGT
ncbi:MAG: peptide deformylase [Thermoleophilia bacterium]|jgi:peptide deformylase